MRPALYLLLALGGCKDQATDDTGVTLAGPVLTHEVPAEGAIAGQDLTLAVTATDPDEVGGVELHYREVGSNYWITAAMATEDFEHFEVTVPGEAVTAPGMDYYFKAADLGETVAVSFLPGAPSQADPFRVHVYNEGQPLPFLEDFELDEGQADLFGLGWARYSAGFPGNRWELSGARSSSGEVAVAHLRGVEGVGASDDWLISPALDFTGQERLQVSWMEFGLRGDVADHGLYVSTGSRDPEDGEFTLLASLEPPADAIWGRSQVVELSDWAGQREVYLAWRYAGEFADDWFIDDVAVRSLTLDLGLSAAWMSPPVHPGETGTLRVSVDNLADVGGDDLTLTVTLPEGAGVLSEGSVSLGSLGPTASTDADLELTVDGAWPDNSYLPVGLSVTDGVDTWTDEAVLVVGHPSEGRLELTLSADGVVQVALGVGDPEAPTWEQDVYSGWNPAGAVDIAVDLTDRHALLPPGAGPNRWYAKVTAGVGGRVDGFEIDHADTTWASTGTTVLVAQAETLVWLPPPPVPTLVTATTSVSPLTPGVTGVSLIAELRNEGAATAGAVTVSLVSDDPDVTIRNGGPRALTQAVWGASQQVSVPGGFSFDVSAEHVDSANVNLELLLDDGVEQWRVPVGLDVPWPVLRISAVAVDDSSGGDGDGLLEPGETAELDLEITNTGDLDAFGVVYGSLAIGSASSAAATTPGTRELIGAMNVGRSRTETYTVTVGGGAQLGESLVLELNLEDDRTTYLAPVRIVLGELPWIQVSPSGDRVGDNLNYTLDLVNVSYRTDGTTFELMVEAAEPFNRDTAFFEMWGVATAANYTFYRLVLQSGVARLQGYRNGFNGLNNPTVTWPDDTHVVMSWPVADMGLVTTSFRAGFGAGWCGSQTGAYCDHFPDAWGYYYTGYTSADFFTLRW